MNNTDKDELVEWYAFECKGLGKERKHSKRSQGGNQKGQSMTQARDDVQCQWIRG